jgi:hypothetical protein
VVLLAVLGILAAFGAGYALALVRTRAERGRASLAATVTVEEVARDEPGPLPEGPPEALRVAFTELAAEGTPEWRMAMGDLGDRLRLAGVRFVVFVHGSFVGDDPLSIARAVEDTMPALPELARAVRGFTRSKVHRVLGDLSNYHSGYVGALGLATGIDAVDFTWSGENHHAARVQEAVRLARALALHGGGALRPGERVLLVGHSHGGQLFALLSQLVGRSRGYEELIGAAAARGEDVDELEGHLALLRRCVVDVATFGTPPRYGWSPAARFRLMHVVNHRGVEARAGSLRGLLHTRTGDYVHQLGAPGSDWPASSARDRALNARLDRILGVGTSLRAWLHHVARGVRVAPQGLTVLVDYGDAGKRLPNFWETGFGHAAYTRRDAMLFHLRLVADHFYPSAASAPKVQGLRAWIDPKRLLPARRRTPSAPDA